MAIRKSSESTKQAFLNIKASQEGDFKPLLTRYSHFNDICNGGIVPGKIYTLGALSSFGKSYTLRNIEKDLFDPVLNPKAEEEVVLLKYDWEMTKEDYVASMLQQELGIPFKELLYNEKEEKDRGVYEKVYGNLTKDYLYENFEPMSPEDFYAEVKAFCTEHKDKKQILVTIDNINLVAATKEQDGISKLTNFMIKLKREFKNTSFLCLAQLNRDLKMRNSTRKEHFPRTTDFYWSSKIEHASDILLVIHNPYMLGIDEYGVINIDKYEYLQQYFSDFGGANDYTSFTTKGLVFWHYLKVRMRDSLQDFQDVFVEEILNSGDRKSVTSSESKGEGEGKSTYKGTIPSSNHIPKDFKLPDLDNMASIFDDVDLGDEEDVDSPF